MSDDLGEAVLDLTADTSGLDDGMDQAESNTKSRMAGIAGAVGKAAVATAATLAAAGGAAVAAAFKTAAYGDEVAKTATKLGVGTDALQEMRYWADQNGISSSALDRAVGRLNQRIGRAADGTGKYAEAFESLGVSIHDTEGNLRSTDDVMQDTIESLRGIEDPAAQSAAAAELFGTKMARDLMPALQDGSLSLEEAAERAHELGLVMDGEATQAAERFQDGWADLKGVVSGFIRDAATPLMTWMADRLFPVLTEGGIALRGLFDIFREGDGVIGGFQDVISELFEGGEGGLFGGLLTAAQEGMNRLLEWLMSGGLESIFAAIIEGRERLFEAAMQLFPVLLQALVEFIPELLTFITGTMIPGILDLIVSEVPNLLDAALTLFQALIDAVLEVLPELVGVLLGDVLPEVLGAILDMIPDLLTTAVEAFLALVEAVLEILPELLTVLLGEVLPAVLSTILDMLPGLLDTAVTLFLALIDAVLTVLPQLVSILLGTVLPALLSALIGAVPQLLGAAVQLFMALVRAIPQIIPQLLAAIGDIALTIIDAVLGIGSQLYDAGRNVIQGLIDGFLSMVGNIGSAIGSVVGTITDFLPWSPAKTGPLARNPPEDGGANIIEQIAEGISSGDVQAALDSQLDLSVGSVEAAADRTDGRVTQENNFEIYEASDPNSTAHRVARLMAGAGA